MTKPFDPAECTLEQRWALVFNTLMGLERQAKKLDKSYVPVLKIVGTPEGSNAPFSTFAQSLLDESATDLTFRTLREANIKRLPLFKNKHGIIAHTKADGSDWSPAQWLQAVIGELGEYANIRKKFERGDLTFSEYEVAAAKELADVQTYLSILALRCLDYRSGALNVVDASGIDLGQATADKFNDVSDRVGCSVNIDNKVVL